MKNGKAISKMIIVTMTKRVHIEYEGVNKLLVTGYWRVSYALNVKTEKLLKEIPQGT